MKILLVAATQAEINPTIQFLEANYTQKNGISFYNNKQTINVLITGVGMVATAYQMGKTLAKNNYDLVINAGIAGAINRELNLGDTVQVTQDHFYNFGAEDKNGKLITVFDLNLLGLNDFPFQSGMLKTTFQLKDLPVVSGITVQMVNGSNQSVKRLTSFSYDTESMEGAAVLYTALLEKVDCCQIRCISNYVEERKKENWNIPLAISNLNNYLIPLFT